MNDYSIKEIEVIINALERVAENGDDFARGYVISQVIAQLKELVKRG